MQKQNWVCCKNGCCKKRNSPWKNSGGYTSYNQDPRTKNGVSRPTKGFVQNLKDKLVNSQNESIQPQFNQGMKKQKDYYCLMLRKINNLDKKLQNLENLFVCHLNHTPNEIFTSSDNEPLCDYMDFYESVRSLVNLASRLKEDILFKQCDSHFPDRNTLHLNDRIQVLDSELQNLYAYLDRLQNCTGEINGTNQCCFQDEPFCCPVFRGGLKVNMTKQDRTRNFKCFNDDCCDIRSSFCVDCCCEADDDSPPSCQCSRCNLNATICSGSPGNRLSPQKFNRCRDGRRSVTKNSDCSCELCAKEKKNKFTYGDNVWISKSNSSCSCELCRGNNRKLKGSRNQNYNSAKIKIIKPVNKDEKEGNISEFEISYREVESSKNDKKSQKSQTRKVSLNEEDQKNDTEVADRQDSGFESKGPNAKASTKNKKGDTNNQEKISKNQNTKVTSSSNHHELMDNVVYYELTPNLNIITKRKNNNQGFNVVQDHYQGKNRNDKKNKNKMLKTNKGVFDKNGTGTYRFQTVSFNMREDNGRNSFPKKVAKNKSSPLDYSDNNQSSSENETSSYIYQNNRPSLNKQFTSGNKKENKFNGSTPTGKHLHIKIHTKDEIEQGKIIKQNYKNSLPERQFKYTNNHFPPNHRQHGGFCHFRDEKETFSNRRFKPFPSYHFGSSESDSFETMDENESDSDRCSQYKLFICDDPDCVEKLDSDELIMLMNKTDMKYCGANPYKLEITENTKDFKSDVCEKCKIKEKAITVYPYLKNKNKNNKEKSKIVIKKEIVECSNCRIKKNNNLSETMKNNGEYTGSDTENRKGTKGLKSEPQNFNKRGSFMKNYYEFDFKDDNESNGENKRSREIKNENKKHSPRDSDAGTTAINHKSKQNKGDTTVGTTLIVASSTVGQRASYNQLKPKDDQSNKPVELPGFGNLININIERGSYSLNKQQNVTDTQKGTDKATSSPKIDLIKSENKIVNTSIVDRPSKSENIGDKVNLTVSKQAVNSVNNGSSTNENSTKHNISSHPVRSAHNKSISALDLVKDSEKEIKKVTSVRSESFTKAVQNINQNSKINEDLKIYPNKETMVYYAVTGNNAMFDGKNGKILTPKKKDISLDNEKSLNYVIDKNPGKSYLKTQGSRYINASRYDSTFKTKSVSKKHMKPRVSSTRIKRSRLKFNHKFGSSLSKVSSAHSIIAQQSKLYPYDDFLPSKKSYLFNPGRRSSKLSKRRHNFYVHPRLSPLRENSLSGIVKPQVRITVQENYQNDFENPPHETFNSRYKVSSISNYLSTTAMSDSSYSTLNWEKVAQKLKEEGPYFNDIP